MEKTIFNCYIQIENQGQADRLEKLCLDNNLPIWDDEDAFLYADYKNNFRYFDGCNEFWISSSVLPKKIKKATEQEFLQLLKEYKDGQ